MLSLTTLRMKVAALPEPVRIGLGLGMGFVVTMTLIVIVMVVGFSYMAKIQADLEQITQINNVKTELAHTMKFAQRERLMSLYAIAGIKDAFEKDEELRRFDSKGAEWWHAWGKFQAMAMNAREQALAVRINSLARERNNIVQQAIDIAMTGNALAASEFIRKVAVPGQEVLAQEIDQLLTLQQEQTRRAVENAAGSYTRTRMLLLWLCGFAVVLSVLIGVMVLLRVMRQSRELEYKALFDDLTGLPNRSLFFDRLKQTVGLHQEQHKPFSIVLADLDRFKEVNDAQGHHVGDLLLKHVAKTINGMMRRTDTVARLGGDEFVLLLPGASAANAEAIVKKLQAMLCRRVSLNGNVVDVSTSMGVASFPEHDEDVARLLLKADIAMYAAKRANVGYRVYTPEIEAIAARNVELQHELRMAIETQQLTLHYQPKISHVTGCIMGVEALVRWNHTERGLIPPDEFIPLAEATGLIQPLAQWVLDAVFRQREKWRAQGYAFSVSVNLSTRNLLDGDLPQRVENLLEQYQLGPEWLVFEITESAVMTEPARALETLLKINKLGIQLSLDDFGTGYSSLAYLKKLPVSEIKIDKSFVKDLEIDSNDTVIVRSTIALGHNLGMKVVAEGVENQEIWELLTQLGCDASQGYHMARPLAPAALDEWLANSEWAREKERQPRREHFIERRRNPKKL